LVHAPPSWVCLLDLLKLHLSKNYISRKNYNKKGKVWKVIKCKHIRKQRYIIYLLKNLFKITFWFNKLLPMEAQDDKQGTLCTLISKDNG
jgi:hypothetical protein